MRDAHTKGLSGFDSFHLTDADEDQEVINHLTPSFVLLMFAVRLLFLAQVNQLHHLL